MKKQFPEYYRIGKEDLHRQFKNLIFIFDANALLDIFRLDESITNEIFEVMERYSSQIVIPHHAAEEYNKNIHSVLQKQLDNIDAAQRAFKSFTQLLEAKRNQPYISANSNRKLNALKKSIQQDFQMQRDYLLDQLVHGELQNKMIELLNNKVLPAFTEDELERIKVEGSKRYEQKIPPGWKDNSKGENSYGDLINWKEILRFAVKNQKSIIFITNDQKEDWMCECQGKAICPHYELLREFYQTVGNTKLIFHIYTLDRFLAFVHDENHDLVSKETAEQVYDVLYDNQYSALIDSIMRLQESYAKINEISKTYHKYYTLKNDKFVFDLEETNKNIIVSTDKIDNASPLKSGYILDKETTSLHQCIEKQ